MSNKEGSLVHKHKHIFTLLHTHSRAEYLKSLSENRFVINPSGNGPKIWKMFALIHMDNNTKKLKKQRILSELHHHSQPPS